MNKTFHIFSRFFLYAVMFAMFSASDLFAQAGTNSTMGWGDGFVKTNGEYVTIGNMMYATNSPANTDEFKHRMWRDDQVMKILGSGVSNATDLFVEGAWVLIKDYPEEANGYQDIMIAIEDYDYDGKPAKSRTLANELIASSAPDQYKLWAKGFLNRLDSLGKPISLKFTAVDGREVDFAKMKGKVVLVDFWATDCGPCVKELPRVKEVCDKFRAQGFEVIGVSCDSDKEQLNKFLTEKKISWPQYYDGKQQNDNKFTVEFGIDGIPHMFLVDKNGFLRFDNVRANDKYHPKGDTTSFEDKIVKLLAED
jgi:thiol-disulfide isomerase/thioredoxin